MDKIKQVAIVGGTHGNEFTGVYLVKKFANSPQLVKRESFNTMTMLANQQAFKQVKRYVGKDLNRCFLNSDLQNENLATMEEKRAKEINQIFGPKGNAKVDFILDLHSTSANMGLSIILVNHKPFNLRVAAYLSTINPEVKIYSWTELGKENCFLNSLCDRGFSIEVGPVAPGSLNAAIFQKTEQLIYEMLDYLDADNQGNSGEKITVINIYQHLRVVDYPKNSAGEIEAMIHPQLQGRDYEPLHPGDPMFINFDGKTIFYEGEYTVYPLFINEVAYYEKGIAMCLTQKKMLEINY
ncbi:aspartoacylase [Calothrix rhizosoleniae]|uniref:aspartoacylase n=1 Tax=Calothrix rhizosoleniae TaxID=888997 RepID=UPI000B49C464|nr:aspartoacylase [Calothrix rhizosoleniae]